MLPEIAVWINHVYFKILQTFYSLMVGGDPNAGKGSHMFKNGCLVIMLTQLYWMLQLQHLLMLPWKQQFHLPLFERVGVY